MHGIADKARAKGVRILEGVAVTGFDSDGAGAVTTVHTDQGDIDVEQVIVGVGPWAPQIWAMLDLPETIDVRTPAGDVHPGQDMWTFWYLQEGEITVDPLMFDRADGSAPPVDPRRHRRAAPRRPRQADHRRAVGHLLQA